MAIELLKMQNIARKVKHLQDVMIQLCYHTNEQINRVYVNLLIDFELSLI